MILLELLRNLRRSKILSALAVTDTVGSTILDYLTMRPFNPCIPSFCVRFSQV